MQLNTIEQLDWDSKFFGYPVAKIVVNQQGYSRLERLFDEIAVKNYKLTYLFVSPEDKEINQYILKKRGALVDQKTVFFKKTQNHSRLFDSISEFQDGFNEKIKELALQSGILSRFRIDKNFKNNEFERLYTEWAIKSVNKEIAFRTLVSIKNSEITGITTLGGKPNYAEIGLVAVEEKYRGQGIGVGLIQKADSIAYELGYKKIKVVTQLQNSAACKLYEKCSFQVESITNIYHYWQ